MNAAARSHYLSRQPLSVLGRIAFGAFLTGTILGGAGALVLTITTGAPSRDILTTTACSLAGTLLIATKLRWTPLVAALLGAYNCYLAFTEPYAVESLANPKGPNGGYGHFAGVVLAFAVTLVAFGASASAAVQNLRQSDWQSPRGQTPRWLPQAASLVVGMAIGALFIGAFAQPPIAPGAGTTFTNGVPTVHMGAGNFLQSSVTIPTGAKLLLVDDSASLHILANGSWQNRIAKPEREPGAPAVNNVQVSGNSVEIGPFATAGTYHLYCLVHPGMSLTILVE